MDIAKSKLITTQSSWCFNNGGKGVAQFTSLWKTNGEWALLYLVGILELELSSRRILTVVELELRDWAW